MPFQRPLWRLASTAVRFPGHLARNAGHWKQSRGHAPKKRFQRVDELRSDLVAKDSLNKSAANNVETDTTTDARIRQSSREARY